MTRSIARLILQAAVAVALFWIFAPRARAAYFDTIFQDPAHPKLSAKFLYTPKFAPDGGVTDVAAVYHRADPADSLWPRALLAAGLPPLSWTLLELGAGGNSQSGFLHFGASVNAAPTILGPLTARLRAAGGTYAKAADVLSAPNGTGLALGLGWKADAVANGGLRRFNQMRFPPRFGVGYTYQF